MTSGTTSIPGNGFRIYQNINIVSFSLLVNYMSVIIVAKRKGKKRLETDREKETFMVL